MTQLQFLKPTLSERFFQYDQNNPDVWELFKMFTTEAIKAGHERFSSQSIIERIRWKTNVESKNSKFKINNDFAAFYARKYHKYNPQYDGFFKTRFSIADLKLKSSQKKPTQSKSLEPVKQAAATTTANK